MPFFEEQTKKSPQIERGNKRRFFFKKIWTNVSRNLILPYKCSKTGGSVVAITLYMKRLWQPVNNPLVGGMVLMHSERGASCRVSQKMGTKKEKTLKKGIVCLRTTHCSKKQK